MSRRSLLLLVVLAGGCSTRDGDILARVLQRTGQKVEAAASSAPGQIAAGLRVPIVPLSPAERVRKRLQWDRYLEGTQFEIDSPAEGVVRLRGQVGEVATKQRMVELARTTIGVTEVKDELRLPKEE